MKKIICILLSLCFCPLFFGCKEKEKQPVAGQRTLMIYMLGSDLEAKGGAGTDDLDEILESGIDTENTNVVIYAGGSKKWHNDDVNYEEGNPVIKLTSDGYEQVEMFDSKSMGESQALSEFLNFTYENYPAENFSLIMWDHGNGPLIGYGKDMLFDNDSLTLSEMDEAFANSPFKEEKLDWIGFDACLMSSAELVCILDDYANYLVASQEIEPAFGWNYDVFGEISTKETEEFLTTLTEEYLISCEEYYEEREYEPQDTTLALIDLSKASELEAAIDNLFIKASADIDSNYNKITTSRVNSRAFGRATTGSEYDLIDIYDMAEQLKPLYSEEAEAIQQLVNEMVISNSTNAEKSCGVSIYYPFYNKKYYEKSWGEAYEEIGVLKEYANYLNKYDDIWLGSDKLDTIAKSISPNAISDSKYTLELTDEQADAYASASYYILQREGEEIYTRIFSSKKVNKNGNTLTADFDGQILYAKNNNNQYWIPVTNEHDTIGEKTHYSVYVNLTTAMDFTSDDYEHKVEGHRFHLIANNETKKIGKSALVPYYTDMDAESLAGGKQEDADLSQWSYYYFLQEKHKYLSKNTNGVVEAFDNWKVADALTANVSKVGDGVEFLFAPITGGEYYLIFEIEDTQGNKYCSDLLSIETKDVDFESEPEPEPIEVDWKTGEKVKLFDIENVELYLSYRQNKYNKEKTEYYIIANNKNDFAISIMGTELFYNDRNYCNGNVAYYDVEANSETPSDFAINFGDALSLGQIKNLDSFGFSIQINTKKQDRTLIKRQDILVNLSNKTTFVPINTDGFGDPVNFNIPFKDTLAKEQVLSENDELKISLVTLYGSYNGKTMVTGYCFENKTSEKKYAYIDGFAFDDVFVEVPCGVITIYPNSKLYYKYSLSESELEEYEITSPSSISVLLRTTKQAMIAGGFSEMQWFPIQLSQKGSGTRLEEGKKVLYNENNVKIAFKEVVEPKYDDGPITVRFTIRNNSGKDISFDTLKLTVNGKEMSSDKLAIGSGFWFENGHSANGKITVLNLNIYPENETKFDISFVPVFYDISEESELWEGKEKINLTVEIK